MKKTYLIFVLLFSASIVLNAQSKSYRIYDKLEDLDGVTTFTFSKKMIDFIDIFVDDEKNKKVETDDVNVTGDLHKIKFIAYNEEKGNITRDDFINKAISMLPSNYLKYEDEDNDDDDAQIYLLGKRKNYKECHVFINGTGNYGILVSFYGNFKVNDIKKLKKKGKKIYKV